MKSSTMKTGKFVLENKQGQVVRTFLWNQPKLYIIKRNDSHRVEPHHHLTELKSQNISFTVLVETTKAQAANGVNLPNYGKLKFVSEVTRYSPQVYLPEEDNSKLKTIFKWTAAGHFTLLGLIFLLNLIISQFFTQKPEEVVVKIFHQPTPSIRKTVTVSKRKVRKRKSITKKRVAKTRSRRVNKVKRKKISQLGALGVLGRNIKSKKARGGLVANSSTARGKSGLSKRRGSSPRALIDKALTAGSRSRGVRGQGVGKYGSKRRGRGHGRAGYGKVSLVGAASNYFHPLSEEVMVQGGLDRSQIAAVINRNKGQITYCYEKGLQTKPQLAGRVVVKFIINGRGRVSTAGISRSSLRSSKVERCILSKLRKWKFPQPVGRVNVRVTYPFVLSRVGQG